MSDNPTQSDYLNIGHLNLVEGNINDAIYHYVKSAIESEKGVNGFMKSFLYKVRYIYLKYCLV